MSFLRARSPVTPNITRPQDPAILGRRRSRGSRNGFGNVSALQDGGHGVDLSRVREVELKHGTVVVRDDGGVALGLRGDELREGEGTFGNLEVLGERAGDLEEHADRRAALV